LRQCDSKTKFYFCLQIAAYFRHLQFFQRRGGVFFNFEKKMFSAKTLSICHWRYGMFGTKGRKGILLLAYDRIWKFVVRAGYAKFLFRESGWEYRYAVSAFVRLCDFPTCTGTGIDNNNAFI